MTDTKQFQKISLIRPSAVFRESYAIYDSEIRLDRAQQKLGNLDPENFDDLFIKLENLKNQKGIVDGYPPQSTYWLIWDQKEVIGKFIIRHQLTPRLQEIGGHIGGEIKPSFRNKKTASFGLSLGLDEVRKLGFTEVIATCDFDNKNAISAITSNGGKFEMAYHVQNWEKLIHRYKFRFDQVV